MKQRDPYFDSVMPERQTLVWAVAVRRQLEQWEPLVARHVLMGFESYQTAPPEVRIRMTVGDYWQGEIDHHFLLIASNNLLKALALLDAPPAVDEIVSAELKEVRDLHEHWGENMPIFQVGPERLREPEYKSGKAYAARNERHTPYCWWAWNGNDGPLVTPHVPATMVHELVESAIAAVAATRPEFATDIAPPAARPWSIPSAPGDGWWPRLPAAG